MRDGRFGHVQQYCQITYAHLVTVQSCHYIDTCAVSEYLEELCHAGEIFIGNYLTLYMTENILMDGSTVAADFIFSHICDRLLLIVLLKCRDIGRARRNSCAYIQLSLSAL